MLKKIIGKFNLKIIAFQILVVGFEAVKSTKSEAKLLGLYSSSDNVPSVWP